MYAGIDTHKDTLAVAVIDDAGRQVAGAQLPNTQPGFVRLVELLESLSLIHICVEAENLQRTTRSDGAAVAVIRSLDAAAVGGRASRLEIQRALNCGGSKATRLSRLARKSYAELQSEHEERFEFGLGAIGAAATAPRIPSA